MADRKDSWFLQLVDEAFFDECFDDLENADRLLAVDIGFTGITSGLVMTEHSAPPDLTVDLTSGVSYDQAGRRCEITSAVSALNCAVDENAVSTAVAAPGNERWLSIQIRFDRTLTNPKVDGNGTTVYQDQDESYELAVVMGPEQAAGTGLAGPGYTGRPALPTDGRLVDDVLLIFGQTAITTVGDIFTERRQDFSIYSAAEIPVTSSGWGFLNPATDDVQAVFDFIDTYSLVTDSSTELLQNIIPSAPGRNLGEAAKEWDLYVLELVTVAASRVDGHLLPKVNGNTLGESGLGLLWNLYSGYISLDGDFKTSAAVRVDGNWLPKAAANDLGSAALPWDLFLRTLTTDGSSRITGNMWPTAGGQDLGSAALPWDLFSEVITSAHATVSGALVFSSANAVTREMNIKTLAQPLWTTSSWMWLQAGVWGGRTITGWTYSAAGATGGDIELDFAHGITVTDLKLSWYQAGGAVTLKAEVFEVGPKGAETSKGSFTISGTGAWKDEEVMGLSDFVVDRENNEYILRVTGVASQDCALTGVGLTATATDLGNAVI